MLPWSVAYDDVGRTALQRHLRRLAELASGFAIAAAAFGMLPDGLEVTRFPAQPPSQSPAGGWTLAVWALAQVWLARRLWLNPGQRQGTRWVAKSLAIDFIAGVLWLVENVPLFDHLTARWPADLTAGWVGCVAVLVFAAIPVILFADDDPTPEVPPARVVAP
jgi:hypothetical protein